MMTFETHRNNVKPMLRFVAFVVVVFLCWIAAGTLQRIWSRQFANTNGVINSGLSFNSFGMVKVILFYSSLVSLATFVSSTMVFLGEVVSRFTFFSLPIAFGNYYMFGALVVPFLTSLTFLTLIILFATDFTLSSMAILLGTVFVKLRKRFDFFAFGAAFGYDYFSHFRFLSKREWLEPNSPPIGLSGSLYCTVQNKQIKGENNEN